MEDFGTLHAKTSCLSPGLLAILQFCKLKETEISKTILKIMCSYFMDLKFEFYFGLYKRSKTFRQFNYVYMLLCKYI